LHRFARDYSEKGVVQLPEELSIDGELEIAKARTQAAGYEMSISYPYNDYRPGSGDFPAFLRRLSCVFLL